MNSLTLRYGFISSMALLSLAAAGLTGCASSTKPPEAPATEASSAGSGDGANLEGKDPNKGNIVIGPKIAALCKLPRANFGFDSAALDPTAQEALDALAACFVSGPAKGKGMLIVGHADPRGEVEYNFGLGQKRAGSVAGYLQSQGVEESRLQTSSRGETEATGTDEAGWAADRKVEIFLAE